MRAGNSDRGGVGLHVNSGLGTGPPAPGRPLGEEVFDAAWHKHWELEGLWKQFTFAVGDALGVELSDGSTRGEGLRQLATMLVQCKIPFAILENGQKVGSLIGHYGVYAACNHPPLTLGAIERS